VSWCPVTLIYTSVDPLSLVGLHSQVEANHTRAKRFPCLGYPSALRPVFRRWGWNFSIVYLSYCGVIKVFDVEVLTTPRPGRLSIWYKFAHRRCKCVVASQRTTRQGLTDHRSEMFRRGGGGVVSRQDEVGSHTRSNLLQGLSIVSPGQCYRVSVTVFYVKHRRADGAVFESPS